MFIEDGRGGGNLVQVNDSNQMAVVAESHELQHHESVMHGNVYQVQGQMSVASGTNNLLYLENENSDLDFCVSYVRIQAVSLTGGTTLPDEGTYFQIGFDNTYDSGGNGVTPVNMNLSTSKVADVIAYTNNPTLAGSFTQVDRWYVEGNGKMMTYNKHGSIIIPKNKSLTIRLVTDHSGAAYCRVTFMYLQR